MILHKSKKNHSPVSQQKIYTKYSNNNSIGEKKIKNNAVKQNSCKDKVYSIHLIRYRMLRNIGFESMKNTPKRIFWKNRKRFQLII